ncbi:RHS repeat-associated core domain-containing protein [Streptomyces sp. NPDC003036]|uniref:RHS repeat domain-containing protein n=1 Tax=Streptomyces sp. NPDC003036 TaxID=3154442 RepID=UPI0033B7D0AA
MRRFGMRGLPTLLAAAVLTGVLPGVALAAGPDDSVELPKMKQPKAVPVQKVAVGSVKRPDAAAANSWRKNAPKVTWPAAGASEVSLDKGGRAGALPVSVSAVPTAKGAKKAAAAARDTAPPKVKVTLAGRDAAQKAGIEGLLLSVHRSDTAKRAAVVPARVTVDYSSFRGAYGGDWAARLRLVQLPACALTTPQVAKCRVQKPLRTTNDTRGGQVTAEAPASRSVTVLAATADASGPTGDYKATSLQSSGSWSAGGSTGAFTWSQPIDVPGVPGGAQPEIALHYNSQTVDGRTAASNNQASWIGDGWDWEPGFIERRYKPCNDDQTGGTNTAKVGDLCWYNDNAILNLGGKNTELVYEKGKGWHPAKDGAEKVEKLTGAINGDKGTAALDGEGEYWKVTAADGVQYFFGLNRLPGWKDNGTAADDPVTNSAWTVPVYGNQVGEPCYSASFASAWCQQAWRWQLDYVVAPGGDAMAYYWQTEANNYARNVSLVTGKGTVTPYVRGGHLDHIDYGLRSDAVYTGKAMGQVHFGVAERCLTSCGTFDEVNAKNWPDVPFDQYCKDGATECKDQFSPTFWSRKRLTSITTKLLTGGVYKDVDSWALAQDFPPAGDGVSTPMWLKTITRTGKAGGSVSLPPVSFAGEQRANRVDKTGDGLAPFVRLRLYQVTTETGATIGVIYSTPDCTVTTLPAPDATNHTRCYPVKWAYEGDTAKLDWFNTYVVMQVVEGDNLAESPDKVTSYSYLGGAAWAESTDEFIKADERTHSLARGYERVQARTGAGSDPRTLTETRYFRGLDGKAVLDSAGEAVTDREQFVGMKRETVTYNGDDTAKLVSATSYTPWRSTVTASRQRAGLPALEAYMTGSEKEVTRTAVTGGIRSTQISRSFDGYGMVTAESYTGDTAKTGDEKCVTMSYARNLGVWSLNKLSQSETVAVPCGSVVNRPADVMDSTRTYYDNGALGSVPGRGLITKTERINGKGDAYEVTAMVPSTCGADGRQLCADLHGRALAAADAFGNVTTTAYTPATGEVAVKTLVTNALGHVVTTVIDPLRGQPTQVTDANGKVVTSVYDALGRVTKVWLATRSASTYPDSPNYVFDYLVRNDGPIVTTTSTLTHDSKYKTAYAIADGMLRPRQTQEASPDRAGRLVTETFYDTRGHAWRNSGTYFAAGAPEPVLVTGQELNYPASIDTEYDGAGRTTAVVSKRFGEETRRTTTVYTGDTTTVIPPAGGTATASVVDALGRVTESKQYTDAARTTALSTKYVFDKLGRLAQVTDPSNAKWTYAYDVRGRQIEVNDPDKGLSKSFYDQGDRVTDVMDARQQTLHYDYDALGRRTALKQGTLTLATWVYDTVAKGHVAKSTRFVGGHAYETAITSYNSLYQPVGQQVTIPAAEGALAGTYKWINSYNLNTGQVSWVQHPAAGGLPQEKVSNTYTPVQGLLNTVGAGADPIISANTYDHYGRNIRQEFGAFGQHLWVSNEFDEHTGALSRSYHDREVAPQRISDTKYGYDTAGNITSIATAYGQDASRSTDTQCFKLDDLRRITEAWTNMGETCAPTPSAAVVGGGDAYWTTYTYDAVGNRKTETRHKTASGPITDTVRTYAAPSAGRHMLPMVTQVGSNPHEEVFGYDVAGNTTSRKIGSAAEQVLGWDEEGHLKSVTQGTLVTSYLYDTEGQRLIRKDSSGATLYLPGGNELKLDKAGVVTGTRYYSVAGKAVAMRVGGKLTFLLSDHHGTGTTQITADAVQAVTRRKTTPFGEARGPQPSSWVGDKGFVGGTKDVDTGLTHLGAREYDPTLGRFISVDPVRDLTDPQQLHGYTYSSNNPVTRSDPSGEYDPDMMDFCLQNPNSCSHGRYDHEKANQDTGGKKQNQSNYYTIEYQQEDTGYIVGRTNKDRAAEIRRKRFVQIYYKREGYYGDVVKLLDAGTNLCWDTKFACRNAKKYDMDVLEDKLESALEKIDESAKHPHHEFAWEDDDFHVAMRIAMEMEDVQSIVARRENEPAPGAAGNKQFDSWVNGIRSEFKRTDNPDRIQGHLTSANRQGADAVYIAVEGVDQRDAMNKLNGWVQNTRTREVRLTTVIFLGENYIQEVNLK